MKIVIDGRMLGWTGIGRYTQRLLEQLEQLDDKNEYIVLIQDADRDKWAPAKPNFSLQSANIKPYSLGEQVGLPLLLRRLQPDLVHFTHFTVPLLYNRPYVVTVHDVILVEHKNYRGQGLMKLLYEIKYLASRLVLSHAVNHARLILTPTNYTKDRLAQMFKLRSDVITATLLGADKLSEHPVATQVTAPYLFSLGNSYLYKNLDRLVDAFAASQFRQHGGRLVLGGQNDYFGGVLRQRVQKLGLSEEVIFPGRVNDDELAGLFQGAKLYVYPSLAEGFGLQALEAMYYGTPVLAAKATSLPEVCGDAAEYFDPTSTKELTTKIDNLLADDARRQELVKLGYDWVKHFSWKAMAEKTVAAYRVAEKKR